MRQLSLQLFSPFFFFLTSVCAKGGLKMSTKTLTDEDLVKLYQDPNFMGSYGGMSNFKHFLYTDYGEVSYHLQVKVILSRTSSL